MTKVLVVDDDEKNLYLLQTLLRGNGYEVISASNGVEALAAARHDPPGVVIADILMPVMDGFSLCRQWKGDVELQQIPFVFYTATYTDPIDEEFALALGADRFIVKPQEPEIFVRMLGEVLRDYESGRLASPREASADDVVYLKEYNEALIRKLEGKMLQLDAANQDLTRQAAELTRGVADLTAEMHRREEAEVEQSRLQEQLARAKTLSAIGSLVAGVAHEVRNPLFGMSATLDAWEAREEDQTHHAPYFTTLRLELQRLTNLMRDLLEYGRPPPVTLIVSPLGPVIDAAVHDCAHLAEQAGVTITRRVETGRRTIRMDASRLRQLLANLLANAIQHSPFGATVAIDAQEVSRGGSSWIECRVSDSGPGVSDEDFPRIFEPFFTHRKGGTGFGLALVQQIAEEHQGQISAANRSAGGAEFTLRLPAI